MCDVHPFEKAGLGLAPFKYVGLTENRGPKVLADGMTTIGSPGQPLGSCDYCGTGIAYEFHIESSDKKHFIVGSDCVCKLSKSSNKASMDPAIRAVLAAAAKLETEKRHAKEAAKIEAGKAFIEANKDKLSKIAHPKKFAAEKGDSALDMIHWYFKNAGTAGKLDAIKMAGTLVEKFDSGNYTPVNVEAKQAIASAKEEAAAAKKAKDDMIESAWKWVNDNQKALSKMPHSKGWKGAHNAFTELVWFKSNGYTIPS